MQIEIERKFLVAGDAWRDGSSGLDCRQGYLLSGPNTVIRIRIMGPRATLAIKRSSSRLARVEYEYPIPQEDARDLLETLCHPRIVTKHRFRVQQAGHTWDIDEFSGDNRGLVVAELELEREDQKFARPDWLGPEITCDPRYLNVNLARRPYTRWKT